jgi:putative transcriptional regulator
MSKAGQRILRSVRKTAAQFSGGSGDGFVVHAPEKVDVRAIRTAQKLTQEEFSLTYALPLGSVRDWEQNRVTPDTATRVLLRVIEKEPKAVKRALRAD